MSFFNQLALPGKGRILLRFPSADGLFDYLGRNGFLDDLLAPDIETDLERPSVSGAVILVGTSANLVEIPKLAPGTSGRARQHDVKGVATWRQAAIPHARCAGSPITVSS